MRSTEVGRVPTIMAGVLLAGLIVQFALPTSGPSAVPQRRALVARPPRLPAPPTVGDLDAILARPLFAPSRSAGALAVADAAPVGALALLGVASTARGASAVLRDGEGVHVVALGAAIAGWRLTAVTRDGAVLRRANLTQALRVDADQQPAPPAAAEKE